jgi:3'(2'), 5'-bisphosphate nucleotidase
MENNLKTSIKAALVAGDEILKVYNSDDFDVNVKSDNSPLTRADKNAHKIIVEYLTETNLPILSEEGKDIPYVERSHWKQYWLVDPLDGTKEFIKRNGEFTVNIALIENSVPVLGVIYVPVTKDLYFSSKELGAYKAINQDAESFNGNTKQLMQSSFKLPFVTENETYTVVGSRSHMNEETEEFIAKIKAEHGEIDFMSRGSSLKICMVAEGLANIYPRFAPTMEWDTGAGHAIALGAGCTVIQADEKTQVKYNKQDLLNPWFIVRR